MSSGSGDADLDDITTSSESDSTSSSESEDFEYDPAEEATEDDEELGDHVDEYEPPPRRRCARRRRMEAEGITVEELIDFREDHELDPCKLHSLE